MFFGLVFGLIAVGLLGGVQVLESFGNVGVIADRLELLDQVYQRSIVLRARELFDRAEVVGLEGQFIRTIVNDDGIVRTPGDRLSALRIGPLQLGPEFTEILGGLDLSIIILGGKVHHTSIPNVQDLARRRNGFTSGGGGVVTDIE